MNLDAVLKEGSVADFGWLEEGLTLDPAGHNRNNDTKPELQAEFGEADISPIFEDVPAGVVERTLDEESPDVGPVVVFARSLMNAGADSKTVDRQIRAKFVASQIAKEVKGLKALFAMDGVVGRFVLDGRVPGGCAAALKQAANSPYKHLLRHVIGCSCGSPQMMPARQAAMKEVKSSGNAVDDFFLDGQKHVAAMIPHCRKSMMPILASMDDLDEQWMSETIIDLANIAGFSPDEVKVVRASKGKPADRLKAAFRRFDASKAARESQKYAGKVQTADFVVDTAENEIELSGLMAPLLDVNPVNEAIQQEFEVDPMAVTNFDGPQTLQPELSEVELCGTPDMSQLDVEMLDGGDIRLAEPKVVQGPVDVNPNAGDSAAEVEGLFPDIMSEEELVDMGNAPDEFFDGCDEIEVEDEPENDELSVSLRDSELEW